MFEKYLLTVHTHCKYICSHIFLFTLHLFLNKTLAMIIETHLP